MSYNRTKYSPFIAMISKFLILLALIVFSTSCVQTTENNSSIEAERDSIAREKMALQKEMEEYFKIMNQIEVNIQKIRNAEKVISLQPLGEESNIDTRNKINEDLAYINEMLRVNRQEISKLKERLRSSSFRSAELERSVARLSQALEDESLKVKALESRIAEKEQIISQLNENVTVLESNVEELAAIREEQQSIIQEQDETIHTAWYVFGTRRELREQKIVTSDGLFRPSRILESDFNKNYFVRIDARRTRTIPLFSHRARILSTHPRTSYTLEKENNNFILIIIDTEEFWSISKYLVIEVD